VLERKKDSSGMTLSLFMRKNKLLRFSKKMPMLKVMAVAMNLSHQMFNSVGDAVV